MKTILTFTLVHASDLDGDYRVTWDFTRDRGKQFKIESRVVDNFEEEHWRVGVDPLRGAIIPLLFNALLKDPVGQQTHETPANIRRIKLGKVELPYGPSGPQP